MPRGNWVNGRPVESLPDATGRRRSSSLRRRRSAPSAGRPGAVSFVAVLDYRRDVAADMYRYDAELGPKVASVTPPPRPTWTDFGGARFAWRGRAHPDGVSFDARCEVRAENGTVTATRDGFRVTGADRVTILLAVGTDFRGAVPAARAEGDLAAARGRSYAQLRSAHVADHQALFRRVSLDLGRNRAAGMPTNRRVLAQMWGVADNRVDQRQERDPDLIALYFQYGRYLMIASSRSGTRPPPLQGLWNDSLLPPWLGQHTSDINVEMNYWPVETTNIAEGHTALFDLIDRFAPAARASAQLSYDARGRVIHAMSNHGPKTTANDWPDFSGWLAQHYWEHYAFSGDRGFLRARAYPFRRECAQFHLDTLIRDPGTGRWLTGPTHSPENRNLAPGDGKPAHVDLGATMSMAIVRAVFTHCLRAAALLDVDVELRAARLGDAALAHAQWQLQLERTTFSNLMDAHPRLGGTTACFQVDGNFGTTAAIAEMLLQSHEDDVHVLPALPAAWPAGTVRGLRARGGYEVDLVWRAGRLTEATIRAQHDGTPRVRYGATAVEGRVRPGAPWVLEGKLQAPMGR